MRHALMLSLFVSVTKVCADSPIDDGYAFPANVDQGSSVNFFLSGKEPLGNVEIPIYDMTGAVVDTLVTDLEPQQIVNDRPWENGFGYERTVSYKVPDDMKSGIYYLAEPPVGQQSWYSPGSEVPFLVKEKSRESDVVVVLPSNTGNAYNREGGNSVYTLRDPRRTVSFERPQLLNSHTRGFSRWLPSQEIDYRYISDVDMDDYSQIEGSQLLVLIGHAEYWTLEGRKNFDRFVEAGGEALVISGNTMYRNVTYDNAEQPTAFSYDLQLTFFHWGEDYPISDSVGVDYLYGGHGQNTNEWTIADNGVPYLQGTGLQRGETIMSSSSEYDGIPIDGYDELGFPIVSDEFESRYHYMNLVGFDRADTLPSRERLGAWIEFQKTPSSGRVITIGSTDWTHYGHYTADRKIVQQVTSNMIDYLLGFDTMADFNLDGKTDVFDIDILTQQIMTGLFDEQFDLNRDQKLSVHDRDFLLGDLFSVPIGDTNLDGQFTSGDLTAVFRAGKYDTNEQASWSEGDWDGNGRFDSADLVAVMADRFEKCVFDDVTCSSTAHVVPEASPLRGIFLMLGIIGMIQRRSSHPRT